MESKLLMFLFLLISSSSCVYVGLSQLQDGGNVSPSMPCVQKLLPCQPYLNPSSSSPEQPAPTCCVPLKEMITHDSKCLCEIFNNAQFFKSFNISQVDALKLPKACGTTADISICKTAAAAPTGPSSRATSNSSASSNSTGSSTSKSAANGLSLLGGSPLVTTFLVVLITNSVVF